MAHFVNPYTFVPHVASPERSAPAGHAQMRDGGLSGVLKVALTAQTPLVIGGFKDEKSGVQLVPRRKSPENKVMIPGSGFLGAVRSVHEVLAGGCLRVLDADFVPVHRHPAKGADTAGLKLAVVVSAGDGSQPQVIIAVCDEWAMIPYQLLPVTGGKVPETGDQFRYPPDEDVAGSFPRGAVEEANGRKVVLARDNEHKDGVPPGRIRYSGSIGELTSDRWVLLVSDTKARSREPVRFAVGRVGPGSEQYVIPGPVLERYAKTVAGADDLRPGTLVKAGWAGGKEPPRDPAEPEYEDVTWPAGNGGTVIGRRLRARTYFHVGQPVWVRLSDPERGASAEVTEIRLSVLWRYQGDSPLGDRVGDAGPCRDPEALCWSCRMFGSADTTGRGRNDLARQDGYRGHVRFGDLLTDDDIPKITWHLAPLSSPSPGAGQFYLDNRKVPPGRRLADRDTKPAATWGSEADRSQAGRPDPRPIRGRKFYWRNARDPREERQPRGRRRDHQSAQLSREANLIPAGTVFTGRVRFDNLSAAEYGSLLAALDPRLLADAAVPGGAGGREWQDVVTSVGGGKPFGFGAVRVQVEPEFVQTARARYLGEPGESAVLDPREAVREFAAQVPGEARGQWERLRHALTPGYVDGELLWYPPGPGDKGEESFDHSYGFFADTSGVSMRRGGDREMVFLPDPGLSGAGQVLDSRGRRGSRG